MQPRKLNIAIARFPYAGNGGTQAECPEVADWLVTTVAKMKDDPRIDQIIPLKYSDTPITMTRNQAVWDARRAGADVLVMIDSDQLPDMELINGDCNAKPFWESSFEKLYGHWEKGPLVIGAPYCGAPITEENVFVFRWSNSITNNPNPDSRIAAYSREEAATRAGFEEVAALPTGLIMFDMRAFLLTEPDDSDDPRLRRGWFYYEFSDKYAREKWSTEDVTATRDISFHGQLELGYNPLLVNWDAWAGHWKPKPVGKPRLIMMNDVNPLYRRAVERKMRSDERLHHVSKELPPAIASRLNGNVSSLNGTNSEINHVPKTRFVPEHSFPDADRDALQALVSLAKEKVEQPIVVETGTFTGNSAIAMAKAGAKVYTIDNWQGSPNDPTGQVMKVFGSHVRSRFEENCGEMLGDQIIPIEADALEAAKTWDKPQVDIVFIDDNHDEEPVRLRIKEWIKHVKPGGIICGHDFIDCFPGVKRAVEDLFGNNHVVVLGYCIWMHYVTGDEAERWQEEAEDVDRTVAVPSR